MEKQVCKVNPDITYKPAEGFDKLDSMLDIQKLFASKFIGFNILTKKDQDKWLNDIASCIMMEGAELREETNWKHWKSKKTKLDIEQAGFELVDINQ